MLVPKDERTKLHDADEAGEVEDFLVRISAVEDAAEIEELGSLVNLGPEAFLQTLFGLALDNYFLDEIEVGKDTDDFGKPMGLKDVEELERFLR